MADRNDDVQPLPNFLTAREAAAALDLSERTVRRAIQRGDLAATKWGGVFRIAPDELARFHEVRRAEEREGVPPLRLVPPPREVEAFRVPMFLAPLIGREREVAALLSLLRDAHGPRLVVLTGPGGVGKTRLAMAIAATAGDIFADGAAVIDLAAIRDAALVPATIARALGVREVGERALLDQIAAMLLDKHLLLVLDNFEHVVEAALCVGHLLAACPHLTVLATSRSRLRLTGEHIFPVHPLPVGAASSNGARGAQDASSSPAVHLFATRAQAIQPGFRLSDEHARVVTDICRRLEGLPLAIELAAAWIAVLPPAALLARLDTRLPLLSEGPRDVPLRLQTMRNAIAWSYDLLTSEEQALFRRLSVFVGGFTLDAAEAVEGERSGATSPALLNLTASLIDKSLLRRANDGEAPARLGMLETIREFGLEQLQEQGELESARQRHAEYVLAFAEESERTLRSREQVRQLARLEAEHDNLRAALTWALGDPDRGETSLRLAGALHWFWFLRDHYGEGRQWLQRAIAQSATQPPTPARVKTLGGAGFLAFAQSDYGAARGWLQQSIALGRALPDPVGLASALHLLAMGDLFQADHAALLPVIEESVALFRQLEDRWGLATSLCTLGMAILTGPHPDAASAPLAESLHLSREIGDTWGNARALHYSGELARLRGDDKRAESLFAESLALYRDLDHRGMVAIILHNQGYVAAHRGLPRQGLASFAQALDAHLAHGDRHNVGHCLAGMAGMAALLGRLEPSARLFGAADMLLEQLGTALWPVDKVDCERNREFARARLGEASFDAAYAAGRAMPLERAVAEARSLAEFPDDAIVVTGTALGAAERPFGLTPREHDVWRLLANHATNREIADHLSISPRTVMHHVSHLLGKLGVTNRRAAAALATRYELD
jgi:excisionase family DNA binding protein